MSKVVDDGEGGRKVVVKIRCDFCGTVHRIEVKISPRIEVEVSPSCVDVSELG